MSRLLHAGVYRLRKSKVLYGCMAGIGLYCIFVYVSQYLNMKKYDTNFVLDPLFFNFLTFIGIAIAVVVSLYVSTEYHDGTIRNKLVGGLARENVYLANFVISTISGLCIIGFGYMLGVVVGIPLFGSFEMPLSYLVKILLVSGLAAVAYVSIFNMISMLCANKASSAVFCILFAFGMMFLAIMMISKLSQPEVIEQLVMVDQEMVTETVKNPAYLVGTAREIYQNLLEFLPAGQMFQVINQGEIHPVRMAAYSSLIIAGTNVIGIYAFKKKDIK